MHLEVGDLLVRHQDVDAEIKQAVVGFLRLSSADERPAADVTRRQSATRRLGVGARHRGDGDAQVIGQVAMRRQARTRPKRALLHVRIDGVRDGPIDGPFSPFQVRQPHCHCRNIDIAALTIHMSYRQLSLSGSVDGGWWRSPDRRLVESS